MFVSLLHLTQLCFVQLLSGYARTSVFRLRVAFYINLSDPVVISLEPLPPPLPSTKKMQAKRADANANALTGEKLSFEAST